MPYCPNCDANIGADATTCPQCRADFTGAGSWKPRAKALSVRRGKHTFWGGAEHFEYDQDEYETLIGDISRHPVKAAVELPIFGVLFGLAILAKNVFGQSFAGVALIALLLISPYYVVQLVMEWRMREHQRSALGQGVKPSYVPSDARGWAALYIGVFFATSAVIVGLDRLTS